MAAVQSIPLDESISASHKSEAQDCIAGTPAGTRKWILGGTSDAIFIANIFWPILLLLQFSPGFEGRPGIQFWQLYFITTPHRWSTLLVVLLDQERFQQRKRAFMTIAVVSVITCLGIRMKTGALTCLLAIDYVWNAWHFAAQHHGIYRIYSRPGSHAPSSLVRLEKWLFRSFLLFVIFRTASAANAPGAMDDWLSRADWISLLIPAWLVSRELKSFSQGIQGRALYLISLMSLYVALLWSVHNNIPEIVLSLATVSAWFHASEYLAIIGWHMQQRSNSPGNPNVLLRWMAPRWGLTLITYVTVLGCGSLVMDRDVPELWLLVNVIVAFLHYTYDGMIWKNRRAAGLQVGS